MHSDDSKGGGMAPVEFWLLPNCVPNVEFVWMTYTEQGISFSQQYFKPVCLNLFLASAPFSDKQISITPPYHA